MLFHLIIFSGKHGEMKLSVPSTGTGAADAKNPNKELRRNVAKLLNTKFCKCFF